MIEKSFWSINFRPPPALSIIFRPLSSFMCSITPETAMVGSSFSHMRSPGIAWLSERSHCSQWSFEGAVLPIDPNIYTDQREPIVIYHFITLLVVIQLCIPRCWYLDSNYCRTRCRQSQLRFVLSPLLLLLRLLGTFQSDIPFRLGQLSTVLTKDESPHTGYTFISWVVSLTPLSTEHWGGGT